MTDTAAPAAPSVYPVLRYRDPAAALAWPETTFDLKESFVARDPGGMIVHAQLAWGPGVIMLGPHDGPDWLPTGPVSVYLACEDPTRITPERLALARRSSWHLPTRNTGHASTAPATPRATSGHSAPTGPPPTEAPQPPPAADNPARAPDAKLCRPASEGWPGRRRT